MVTGYIFKALEEFGLVSLYSSHVDTKLIIAQRFVRLFAYGGSALILVDYLNALGISKANIGLFMALTYVGDSGISLILTLFADALGRKAIMALGAVLMAFSGVIFALSGNYWVLLAAAIIGVISPGGNEIGPFRAIEESTVAHITPTNQRGDIYAWYAMLGTAGTALGVAASGWSITYMTKSLGWGVIKTYRTLFYAYSVFGIIQLLLVLSLSKKVELDDKPAPPIRDPETAPLLGAGAEDVEPKKSSIRSIFPNISGESRVVVINLCLLFGLDSFASGLAPLSWVSFFFKDKFGLLGGTLGSLFFTTTIIASLSIPVASSLAKRFGNVKTMVFAHLPSAIFLALLPVPNTLPFAMLFLILRSCTQSMDVAPRTAFLASAFLPSERTAAMGIINLCKSCAQSLAPLITGVLANQGLFWVAFVTAGLLKATYDIGMLVVFNGHETRDDREARRGEAEEQGRVEEGEEES